MKKLLSEMKPATIGAVAFLLLFAGFSFKVKRDHLLRQNRTSLVSYGDVAPPFTLSRIDGGEVDLSALARDNDVVVVNFWATWCAPCRVELPQMEKLHQSYRDKNVAFLTITSEEEAVVKAFLLEHAYTMPVLLDPGQEVAERYGVESLPTTFVLRRGGKTTTLFMLLGLLRQDSGSIRVLGADPGEPSSRRRLGFMSEIFQTYPFLTARGALGFYGRLSGLSDAEISSRSDAQLRLMGLESAAERSVGSFSKGMTQRLGLAQALIHAPELLILDEPTTDLDPEGRRLVAEIIRREKARGTTVLLSSHILSDVEQICDRVVMIRKGLAVFSSEIAALTAAADEWRVELIGLTQAQVEGLAQAGYRVESLSNGAWRVICSSRMKKELLRHIIGWPVDIESIGRSLSLEDIYMRHLHEPSDR